MALRIGIIGGSALEAGLFDALGVRDRVEHACETPFGLPSGPVVTGTCGDAPIAWLSRHGEGHLLNPSRVPYRANLFALKSIGCTHVVAFGATGSLREHIGLGDLVVCDQLIDRTVGRDRSFYDSAAVHVEFADPFCPVLRQWLIDAASRAEGINTHPRGCYVCIEGPQFSTRAESHLFRQWGADVVGMTALPEARLAREAELAYAMVAQPTDYDCWRPRDETDQDSLLRAVMENLKKVMEAAIVLLGSALGDVEMIATQPSPAHDALGHGIWSDKSKIDPAEVERLRPLWGRHF